MKSKMQDYCSDLSSMGSYCEFFSFKSSLLLNCVSIYNESKNYGECWWTLYQSGWLKDSFHVKNTGLMNNFSVILLSQFSPLHIAKDLEPFITCVTLYLENFMTGLKYFNVLV